MEPRRPAEAWESGDAYELYVGRWSRRVAREFLAWLAMPRGIAWLDVGCGTAALLAALGKGEIDLIIGTHALLEKDVRFSNLRLVIIDEQHKFGVRQRAELRSRGRAPHMLVLTATPSGNACASPIVPVLYERFTKTTDRNAAR